MGDGGGPRDAAFIEGLLQEMGVKEYDPLVVHQLLEVSYSEEGLEGTLSHAARRVLWATFDWIHMKAELATHAAQ